ncbi:DUF2382 domain-containing protein [Alsobacter soli]|nr:DUF2382 domain-containing protein [Alsobacter soli]
MSDAYQASTAGQMSGTGARNVTAMFKSRAEAERAVQALTEEGFAREDIRMVEGNQSASGYNEEYSGSGEGFWASLRDLFFPEEDRHVYAEGLRRGGYLVSVRTTPDTYERAADILDDEGTLDLDQREAAWRSQGWSGYAGSDYAGTASTGTSAPVSASSMGAAGSYGGPTSGSATDRMASTGQSGRAEEVIPIAEEQLRVGKRIREGGRVRVRSYVVEEPVSEQVTLREERVSVERRPVDRELAGDIDPFKERTVELDEKAEQAVVAKEARVREELVVRKDVENRKETINDTVRRTEVDVQDERANKLGTGTTGEPPRR